MPAKHLLRGIFELYFLKATSSFLIFPFQMKKNEVTRRQLAKFRTNFLSSFSQIYKTSTAKTAPATVSFCKLYSLATKWQKALVVISCLCSVLAAIGFPFIFTAMGEYFVLMLDRTKRSGPSAESSRTNLLNLFGGGKIM